MSMAEEGMPHLVLLIQHLFAVRPEEQVTSFKFIYLQAGLAVLI